MAPVTLVLVLLVAIGHGLVPTAVAQESPLYNNFAKFDRSTPHRQNLCGRQRLLYNDNITLSDALKGLRLNIVLTDYSKETKGRSQYLFALNDQGKIPAPPNYPGLFAVILDELASRAGFTWRDTFATIRPLDPNTDGNKTWTDIIEWETDTFDLAVEYYSKSIERIALGNSFPEGWFDSSIIFVERLSAKAAGEEEQEAAAFYFWAFLRPFEMWVWIFIVIAIIFTGIVYWLLERLDDNADERNLDARPDGAIFLSAITFTGHFEFRPNSHVARLVAFSWSFWALLTAAAYTANLASFLVAGRTEPTFQIKTVEQAVRMKLPLCVRANTWNQIWMQNTYGDLGVNLIGYVTEDQVFAALRNGECVAALTQASVFHQYERDAVVNMDCSLQWNGVTAQIIQGGFATAIDSGTLCTSLISHVLDLQMLQMKSDGFVEKAWQEHLDKLSSHTCSNVNTQTNDGGDDSSDSYRLTVKEMGGIFLVHTIICLAAVCIGLAQFYWRSYDCHCRKARDREDRNDHLGLNHAPSGGGDGTSEQANARDSPRLLVGSAEADRLERGQGIWNKPGATDGLWNSVHLPKKRSRDTTRRVSMWATKETALSMAPLVDDESEDDNTRSSRDVPKRGQQEKPSLRKSISEKMAPPKSMIEEGGGRSISHRFVTDATDAAAEQHMIDVQAQLQAEASSAVAAVHTLPASSSAITAATAAPSSSTVHSDPYAQAHSSSADEGSGSPR